MYGDIMHARAAKALSNIDAFLRQTYYQGKTFDLTKQPKVNELKKLLKDDRARLLPLVHDLKKDKERFIKRNTARYVNNMSGVEVGDG